MHALCAGVEYARMALILLYLALSAGLSVMTFFLSGLYSDLAFLWLPFVLVIGFYLIIFIIHSSVCSILGAVYTSSKKEYYEPNRFAMYILSSTCRMIAWFFRCRIRKSGWEKLPQGDDVAMIATNHIDSFDYICLLSRLSRRKVVAVSKKSNEQILAAGGIMKRAGYLSIVQGDLAQGKRVIDQAGAYLRDGVASVCISPEGTRNKAYPNPMLLPFHPGSFEMAKIGQKPIVLLAFQNTNCVFKRFPWRSTKIYMDVVDVLQYDDYKDLSLHEIAELCHGKILAHLEEKEPRAYLHSFGI